MIDPQAVREQADQFALQIMETLAGVLPTGNLGFNSSSTPGDDRVLVVVSQAEDLGIPLVINGKEAARLVVEYRLTVSDGSQMLAVKKSMFKVFAGNISFPVFALDYVYDMGKDAPAAHWNVYANRKDVSEVMRRAGAKRRGKANRRAARDQATGVVGSLHFPVGGHRFRPCLEDVLDMLWAEWSIDVRPTARKTIDEGRERWRKIQLSAAVSDDPYTAAKELVRLGVPFDLDAFPEHLQQRRDRTTAY